MTNLSSTKARLPLGSRSVLIVGNFLSKSGASRGVCEDLAEQLANSEWFVITTSTRRRRIPRLVDMVVTSLLKRKHYVVAQIDIYSGSAFIWAEMVCWMLYRLRKPYILTLHGGNLPSFARRWPARVRCLLRSAQAVTTPSRYLLEQMQAYCKRMILLPNPIDLKAYTFQLRSYPKPQLIWLRAFHQIYNPQLAVEVIALLQREFPDIQLIMFGPDKGDGTVQRTRMLAVERGISRHIHILGSVLKPEVPSKLQRGDIFLNTSNVDNAPVSVVEAMACGLCVVSTNVGGISYLATHDHNALLVPPNDPEAMAIAVRRFLIEPGLSERLSRNARAMAEQFDWSIVLPEWNTLLTEVAMDPTHIMGPDI